MVLVALAASLWMHSGVTLRTAQAGLLPPEPLPLGGYTQRAEKPFQPGGDDLKVRVMVVEDGRKRVAIASVEMLTIPESLFAAVKAGLPQNVHLFLAATHTHCAPDSQMLNSRVTLKIPGIALFNQKWLDWYANRIAETVRAALVAQERDAKRVEVLSALLPLNRARRAGGHPDPTATLVRFENSNGEMSGGWFTFAAHPVFYGSDEMHTRGDWPGKVADLFGVPVLQGAIGDISPRAPGDSPHERIANFAQAVGDALLAPGKARAQSSQVDGVLWNEEPIALDPIKPHPEFGKTYGIPDALAALVVGRIAPPKGNVVGVRFGKVVLIGVPGEPSGELGWQIRNYGLSLGFGTVLVSSHVNGWIGYILEPSEYDKGGYEATLGFHGRETGARVVEAAKSLLRRLAGKG